MSDPRWNSLKYYDPAKVLAGLDSLFDRVGIRKYKHPGDILLQRRLRPISEFRRCAIFLHGASQAVGTKLYFAEFESSDYDYVGTYIVNGVVYRFPIQLKQFVPNRLNSKSTLQAELDKLGKYGTSSDLIVAVHINRQMQLKPLELRVSHLPIKELWLFGQHGPMGGNWILVGNLKADNKNAYTFTVPAA